MLQATRYEVVLSQHRHREAPTSVFGLKVRPAPFRLARRTEDTQRGTRLFSLLARHVDKETLLFERVHSLISPSL